MSEEIKEKYEGHGRNWKAVFGDIEENKFMEIANTVCNGRKNLIGVNGDFYGYVSLMPSILAIALIRKDRENKRNVLESMYPFFRIDNPVEVEINKINEWKNKNEAVIEGSVGGTIVSFFDTFYFLNKRKYKIGQTYPFNLIGLAHLFRKRTEDLQFIADAGPMKGEKVDLTQMTAYFPSDEYGGEFVFCSPFEGFSKFLLVFGSKFYIYPFYLRGILDNAVDLRFSLLVREQILEGYKPELNDPIEGTGWLQGYLADRESICAGSPG